MTMTNPAALQGWTAQKDPNSGRTYYANSVTRKTQWEKPEGWVDENLGSRSKDDDDEPLPEGVEKMYDPTSQKPFYVDHIRKVTTWTRPHVEKPQQTSTASLAPARATGLARFQQAMPNYNRSHYEEAAFYSHPSTSHDVDFSDALPKLDFSVKKVPDSLRTHCPNCDAAFTVSKRRHHCRLCGDVFCDACSSHRVTLPLDGTEFEKPVRVCDFCNDDVDRGNFFSLRRYLTPLHLYFPDKEEPEGEVATADNVNAALSALTTDVDQMVNHPEGTDEKMTIPPDVLIREVCKHLKHHDTCERACVAVASLLALENMHGRIQYASQVILYGAFDDVLDILERSGSDRRTLFVQEQAARIIYYVTEKRTIGRVAQESDVDILNLSRAVKSMLDHASSTKNPNLARWSAASLKNLIAEDQRRATMAINDLAASVASGREPKPVEYESFLEDLINSGGIILLCGLIGSSDADARAHAVGALEMALNSTRAVDASMSALFEMTGGLTGRTNRKDGDIVHAIVAGGGCSDPVSQLLLSAENSVAGMGCLFLSSIVSPLLGDVEGCGGLKPNYDFNTDNSSFGACREAVVEIATGSCLPALLSIARASSRRSTELRKLAMQTLAAVAMTIGEMGRSWSNGQFEEGMERSGAPAKLKESIIILNEEGAIDVCLEILQSSAGQSLGSSAETDSSRIRESAAIVLGSLASCSTEAIMTIQSKNILAALIVASNDASMMVPSTLRGDGAPKLLGIVETLASVLTFEWQHPSGAMSELLDRLLEVVDAGVIPYLSRVINMKIDWESSDKSIGPMRARTASCRVLSCVFGIALTDESSIGFRRVMEAVDADSRSYRGGDKAPSNIVEAALTVLQSSTAMARKVMLGTASEKSYYSSALTDVVEASLLAAGSMCGSSIAPGGSEGSMISGENFLSSREDQYSQRRAQVCKVTCDVIVRRGRTGPALLPSMLVGGFGEGACLASLRVALAIAQNGSKEEHAKLAMSGLLVPISDSLKSALSSGDLYKFSSSLALIRFCGPHVAAGQQGGVESVRDAIKVATNVLTLPINPEASFEQLEVQEALKAECISALESLSRNSSLWGSISSDALPSITSYLQTSATYGIGGAKGRVTMAAALRAILQIVQVPSHAISAAEAGIVGPLSLLLKVSDDVENDPVSMLSLEVLHTISSNEKARSKASFLESGLIGSICSAIAKSASTEVKPEKDARADITFLGLEILYRAVADIESTLSVPEIIQSPRIGAFLESISDDPKFVKALCATLLLRTGMKIAAEASTYDIPNMYGPPLVLVQEKCAGLQDTHEAAISLLYSIAVYASTIDSKASARFWETVALERCDDSDECMRSSATLNVYFLSLLTGSFEAFDAPHRNNRDDFESLLKPLLRLKLLESLKSSVDSLSGEDEGDRVEDPFMIALMVHFNVPHICLASWTDPALLDLSFDLLKTILDQRPDDVLHLFVDDKAALLSLFDLLNKDVTHEGTIESSEIRRFLADILARLGESSLLSASVKKFDIRHRAIASLAAGCLGEEERPTGEDEDVTSSRLSSILMQCLVDLCAVSSTQDDDMQKRIDFAPIEAEILAETLGKKMSQMVISRFIERAKLKQYEFDEDEDIMEAPDVAILCAISQHRKALDELRSLGGLHALSLVAGEGKMPAIDAIKVASKDNIETLLEGDTYISLMKVCSLGEHKGREIAAEAEIAAFSLLSKLCETSTKGRKAVSSADSCEACIMRGLDLLSSLVDVQAEANSENEISKENGGIALASCACIFLSAIATSTIGKRLLLQSSESLETITRVMDSDVLFDLQFALLKLVSSMTLFVDNSEAFTLDRLGNMFLHALKVKEEVKAAANFDQYLFYSTALKGVNPILPLLAPQERSQLLLTLSELFQYSIKSLVFEKSNQNVNEKANIHEFLYMAVETLIGCSSCGDTVFSQSILASMLTIVQWRYDPKTSIEKHDTSKWNSVAGIVLSAFCIAIMRPDTTLDSEGIKLADLSKNNVMLTRAGKAPRKAIDVHSVLDLIVSGTKEGNSIAAERIISRLY